MACLPLRRLQTSCMGLECQDHQPPASLHRMPEHVERVELSCKARCRTRTCSARACPIHQSSETTYQVSARNFAFALVGIFQCRLLLRPCIQKHVGGWILSYRYVCWSNSYDDSNSILPCCEHVPESNSVLVEDVHASCENDTLESSNIICPMMEGST